MATEKDPVKAQKGTIIDAEGDAKRSNGGDGTDSFREPSRYGENKTTTYNEDKSFRKESTFTDSNNSKTLSDGHEDPSHLTNSKVNQETRRPLSLVRKTL
jgi:hypothetical protein